MLKWSIKVQLLLFLILRDIANFYNKSLAKLKKEEAIPMWILCNPSCKNKPLLLTVQSDENHFTRGIVTYEGIMTLEEVDVDRLIEEFAAQEAIKEEMVITIFQISISCNLFTYTRWR